MSGFENRLRRLEAAQQAILGPAEPPALLDFSDFTDEELNELTGFFDRQQAGANPDYDELAPEICQKLIEARHRWEEVNGARY